MKTSTILLGVIAAQLLLGCNKQDSSEIKTLDNFTREQESLRMYACEGDSETFGTEPFLGRKVLKIHEDITVNRNQIEDSFNKAMSAIPEQIQDAYFILNGAIEIVPKGWCSRNMGDALHQTEKEYFSERVTGESNGLSIHTCAKQSIGNSSIGKVHTQYIELGEIDQKAVAASFPTMRHNVVRAFGYILATRLSHLQMDDTNNLLFVGAEPEFGFVETRIELTAALLTDLSTGDRDRYSYDATVSSYLPCNVDDGELFCHDENDSTNSVEQKMITLFNIRGADSASNVQRKTQIRGIVDQCSQRAFDSSACLAF